MSYSSEVLSSLTSSDGAALLGDLPVLKKEAKLSFRCKCGKEDTKTFVRAKISGLLCKECTKIRKREKTDKTNLEKYGNICSLQGEAADKKAKETLMKRFGCKNPFMNKEIQQQIKETNKEKYGSENPFGSPVIKEKLRKTCKEKYGTEFPMKCKEISDKTKATNIIKYGVEISSKAEPVKQKARETNMILYGETHHIVPAVMEKARKTNLDK